LSSVKRLLFFYLVTWTGCAVLLFLALRPKSTAREVVVTSAVAAAALVIVGVRLYDLISAIRRPPHTLGRRRREERREERDE
jgi:hypothetical protein